jgi:YVTN family beta-propeller protein
MAVTPNGRTLYVLNSGGDTVTPIRIATNTAGASILVPHEPFTLAITPDGKTLYVTGGANLLTPIHTSTNQAGTPIVVGQGPSAIAFAVVE